MDIFSHGLWAGAAAYGLNRLRKKPPHQKAPHVGVGVNPVSVWKFGAWGVFPDLFSFSIAFIWMRVTGARFDAYNAEPFGGNSHFIYKLTNTLYNLSHSLIIFLIIFGLVWLLFKRPIWELGGWLVHILIDVPTHSYAFFPTPVLWPASGWKFDGFSWGQPWFMVLDIAALSIVYLIIWYLYQQRQKKSHGK